MPFPVRPEWSTASVGSSHAPTDAVDHSAPSAIRPESTYISGKVVQTNGATSDPAAGTTGTGGHFGGCCCLRVRFAAPQCKRAMAPRHECIQD